MTRRQQKQPENNQRRFVRCAVYTRKSTEEGLEQEFNSLDAQREAGEAYIKSQVHEGWELIETLYDDGGFTGANMERPALQQLLADIAAKRVDCVVVYKVDRLSRSLLDFSRIMEAFDRHGVSFVSVTQAFNTASSMGRLILNVLLSFAQFEREMISERTRDKIAAARRKGKWSGGRPLLGYNVVNTKLVIEPEEAVQVREIFALYLKRRSLLAVVKELNGRGWVTKRWTTKLERSLGGRPFDKTNLYQLLTNVTYIGKIRYKDEVHQGEHEGIVDPEVFAKTQEMLTANGRAGGRPLKDRYGALLRGLMHCESCDCAMTHSMTNRGTRRYRYYVCTRAQKQGWKCCPRPSIPAGDIEQFVVDQIRRLGRNEEVVQATLRELRQENEDRAANLQAERRRIQKRLEAIHDRGGAESNLDRPEREHLQRELARIHGELEEANEPLDEKAITRELGEFEGLWQQLSLREQGRILSLLVERVAYNAQTESVKLTLSKLGIRTLATRSLSSIVEPATC